ncbi:MAG TPA: alanine--tRNA ligase [Candidatus Omnitrophota bacterium]|nr:alanine--tRNA ligase [Candidatus Omnitrophota bacterium]
MTTTEIRSKFLNFFASKSHKIIKSDSLVPKDDPTVLFTTAGMQQFKRQFLGHLEGFTRAATSQKCLRTDDLEEVGKTDFHHTFFEMLGNFSFGDYFKKDAILWAWEFLTKELKIPSEKLWVSVYKDDAEAYKIWLDDIKIPKEKIVKLGDKSNFWPSEAKEKGPNGPCGPCSEIFYDYGVNKNCIQSDTCDPSCNCGRFSEIWNLVFTQFNRKDGGVLEPLPAKNIDTGMGLERLASVMQGKKNNFETDIFKPILEAIDENIKIGPILPGMRNERYVLADHIRAVVFGISDGVVPSNEGRGYIMKKLIIAMSDIAIRSGNNKPTIYKLVPTVITAMQEQYPEIKEKAQNIADIIKSIEMIYIDLREKRIPELEDKIFHVFLKNETQQKNKEVKKEVGQILFLFKDTHGLTIETMRPIVWHTMEQWTENDWEDALKEFNQLMQKQQEQSRAGSKMTGDVFANAGLNLNVAKTEFLGYNHIYTTSTVLALLSGDKKVTEAKKDEEIKIILNKTPFYAEGGGQIGDTGKLTKDDLIVKITDTKKMNDIFIHMGIVEEGTLRINDMVKAEIDIERRLAIMRNHTSTHLLQSALRDVLGSHVQQQGSFVDDERLRFDFTHPKSLTEEQITAIEEKVNRLILDCDTVTKEYLSIDEAKKSGALAFFAEKYGEVVRVVTIGDYSKEFCGGTHLDSTGQIGLFKIISESAIAQGIRRIEAKTGLNAFLDIKNQEKQLLEISRSLKVSPQEIAQRIHLQAQQIKSLEKELSQYRFENIKSSIDSIIEKAETVNNSKIITHHFTNIDMDLLRKAADVMKQKTPSAIIVLGATTNENASLLVAVSDDLIKKNIKADILIKPLATLIKGSGGGRPQMAQAGSKQTDKIPNALLQAKNIIKETLSS